ncbi:MAG: hypothetical protein E7378_02345 [Clostridiales bacterium]|nr:hypothetical protein [Clostridiales bacterium]
MLLSIVQTIWSAFSDLVNSVLGVDIIFYIGLAFLALMAVFFFIRARMSYEHKLDKTADRLNNWLFRHQTINEQNLVEFNNIIKDKKSPKILRKYWQQYMLYRDKQPSEYMSAHNCIDKPLKTSNYTSSIKNFSMIYKLTALVTFFFTLFVYAGRSNTGAETLLTYITTAMISSIIILFVGVVLTLALRAMQNYNIATLYQTFNVFNRYIDKACASIPKYVDFEILFTQKEIKEGIPILGEYLEKRARQEQEELEEAQRNAVAHEAFDFSASGIDGSLVLERAMRESETYMNAKQRLLGEIQQFEVEISTLKKNYENTSKDYQRKLQASKENLDRLRQQQEESTNRIEVNYIRKQQQDEVKKQEILEKDQEDATNKFNSEIKTLNEEIEKRRIELEGKLKGVEEAMSSEYQTFAQKLHKSIIDSVEQQKKEAIDQVTVEKNQYAQAISYLKKEVDSRDALIISKDQTIAELATKLQDVLAQQLTQAQPQVASEVQPQEIPQEVQPQEQVQEQPVQQEQYVAEQPTEQTQAQEETSEELEGHYDDRGYYWFSNGTYYDADNLYHDLEGNVMDADGNILRTGEAVEKEQKPISEIIEQATDAYEKNIAEQNQLLQPTEEQISEAEEQPVEEQPVETVEEVAEETVDDTTQEQPQQVSAIQMPESSMGEYQDGKYVYPNGTYYDENNLYHDENGIIYNTEGTIVDAVDDTDGQEPQEQETEQEATLGAVAEQPVEAQQEQSAAEVEVEQPAEQIAQEAQEQAGQPIDEQPQAVEDQPVQTQETEQAAPAQEQAEQPAEQKRKAGRPKKEVIAAAEEEQPKRKAGRPKKVVENDESEQPKRSVGRPKKEVVAQVEEQPKRKAGRPKKEATPVVDQPAEPKRKAGRPKKVIENVEAEQPKRSVGRPKKEVVAQVEEQPKRKAGRPKKEAASTDQPAEAKRKVGRPKKEVEATEPQPKRSVGRPKKDQSAETLKKLGEALINISNKKN